MVLLSRNVITLRQVAHSITRTDDVCSDSRWFSRAHHVIIDPKRIMTRPGIFPKAVSLRLSMHPRDHQRLVPRRRARRKVMMLRRKWLRKFPLTDRPRRPAIDRSSPTDRRTTVVSDFRLFQPPIRISSLMIHPIAFEWTTLSSFSLTCDISSAYSGVSEQTSAASRPCLPLNLNGSPKRSRQNMALNFGCSALLPTGETVDPKLSLEKQGWYHGAIARLDAENLLRAQKEGSYLVRISESSKQDYSLSIK